MAATRDILPVDELTGKTVISRATGNKLGRVTDLLVHPTEGVLLGLTAHTPDERAHFVAHREVYSFGPDAVMVNTDESLAPAEDAPLGEGSLARRDLLGAAVITEGGRLLGQIADVFVHGASSPPRVIYELRESLLDKLLGRALYVPASDVRAISTDGKRIVVPDRVGEGPAESLGALADRLGGATWSDERTLAGGGAARSLGPFEEGTIELAETTEEPVVSKRARVVEEVVVEREVGERSEAVRDTLRSTDVEVEELNSERVGGVGGSRS